MKPNDFPLLRDSDPQQLKGFLDECTLRMCSAGQQLMAHGDQGLSFFFLLDGHVRVMAPAADGDRELAELAAPAVLGEMELLTEQPRSASVTAIDDGHLLEVSFGMFRRRMNDSDPTAMRILAGIARVVALRLAALNKRVCEYDPAVGRHHLDELTQFQHQLFSRWTF